MNNNNQLSKIDLIIAAGVVVVTAIIVFTLASLLIPKPGQKLQSVPVVPTVTSTIKEPSSDIYNTSSINPALRKENEQYQKEQAAQQNQ